VKVLLAIAQADLAAKIGHDTASFTEDDGSPMVMPPALFEKLRTGALNVCRQAMSEMSRIGFEEGGAYIGDRRVLNRFNGAFQVVLLGYAGGVRACTLGRTTVSSSDGGSLVVPGFEKNHVRRIFKRQLHSGSNGSIMSHIEPFLCFFGGVKEVVCFYADKVRPSLLEELKRTQCVNAADWRLRVQNLERGGLNFVFNTKTGNKLETASLTHNIRVWAKALQVFPSKHGAFVTTQRNGRQWLRADGTVNEWTKSIAMRRAFATFTWMSYQQGKLGRLDNGRMCSSDDMLCHLSTVMNTSPACLITYYIKCPMGDAKTQLASWAIVMVDQSGAAVDPARFKAPKESKCWDCPDIDKAPGAHDARDDENGYSSSGSESCPIATLGPAAQARPCSHPAPAKAHLHQPSRAAPDRPALLSAQCSSHQRSAAAPRLCLQ
jgi:hypothetical protein